MKSHPTLQSRDLLNSHASLKRRIKNLLDGATPMPFYMGAYGLNTSWIALTPQAGWHYIGGAHVHCRVRSDVIYLVATGPSTSGIAPVSPGHWPTGPALSLPGKPHVFWPSYRVRVYCRTTNGGYAIMTIKPNGKVYVAKPNTGYILRPGSSSWPRG